MSFRYILEATGVIRSLSKQTGKPESEVEQLWNKAKGIAAEEGKREDYSYITGVLKNMLGIK